MGLNECGPHRLMGMVLYERLRHVAFRVQTVKPGSAAHSLFLLPADPDVELYSPLSAFSALILPTIMTMD